MVYCNESAFEAVKRLRQVIKSGTKHMSDISPNIKTFAIHESFIALGK